jgi:hypothetical protein
MAEKQADLQSTKDLFGNFTISDSVEMQGSQELLEGLLSPETATSSIDEIEEIKEEKPAKSKEKETSLKEGEKKKPSKENINDTKLKQIEETKRKLEGLLEGNEEEETDEEESKLPSKEVKSSDNEEDTDEEVKNPESNQFEILSKELTSLGVFSTDEGEEEVVVKTPEQFLERFNYEKEKGAREMINNFIGQFGEDRQHAFSAIFEKGVDPKEYFSTYNNIENLAELDLTKDFNQEAIVKQFYTEQGLHLEAVKSKIEKLKNYGDLEDESKNLHEILVKKEAQKLTKLEQESELKIKQLADVKNQYIKNVNTVLQNKLKDKEFDGIPINPKLANELQDFLTQDKYKTPSGETLTDFDRTILELKRPENHEMKVKIGLLLKILEKDPTLSTIQKTGVTKKSNALFGELVKQTSKTSAKSSKQSEGKSSLFSEYL